MAYKADLGVKSVHGTNPQNLIEHIVRERIFASTYWKEECFGLNAAALAKRAMNLTYVGGTWGGHRRPTPFLCLLLKMLMIQPEPEIVEAFISEKDFRYVRLLGAFYLRLVGSGSEIYKCLETLYSDNRKFKFRQLDGTFTVDYIDNFVDSLLTTVRVCDTTLPPLVSRKVLMDRGKLGKRTSLLDDMLLDEENDDEIESSPSPSNLHYHSSDDDIPSPSLSRKPSHDRESYHSSSDEEKPQTRFQSSSRYSTSSPSIPSKSPTYRGNHSPQRRSSARSPDTSPRGRERGQRSPDVSPSRNSRGNRSPDMPPSARRGERSPDIHDIRPMRGERSPESYRPRNESPRRSRGDRSPETSRHRRDNYSPVRYRQRSPDYRETDRYRDNSRRYDSPVDQRRSDQQRSRYHGYEDYTDSRKRGRSNDDRYDDDRYGNEAKRPKYSDREDRAHSSRSNRPHQIGRSGSGSGGGGKKGGLREMSTDEMNELRKSIGLGPLRS